MSTHLGYVPPPGGAALDSDLAAIAALSTTAFGRALLELANAAAGRTAFGLGTASTHAHGDYDAAGAAAAAQAASQPLDSDLTAIAALSTTAFGRSLLDRADAAAVRTLIGLGTAATHATGDYDAAGAAAAAQAAAVQRTNHTGTQTVSTISDIGNLLPWLVDVDVVAGSHANTNFATVIHDTTVDYAVYLLSSGAQNDEINWDVVLGAGTWDLTLTHIDGSNRGIYTVQLDGVTKGTIDGYSLAASVQRRSTLTGIVVVTTAKVRLKLKMATQNGAASGFYGSFQHVQLRRTA